MSLEEVIDAVSLIRTLNPRPGNSFASSHTLEYIVPDVLVYETKDGFEVVLNNAFFPRLTISPYYRDIIKDEKAEDAREYVCDKIRQAEWAMKCISKRNSTLQKTLEVILDLQREFFEQGPGHLRPMRLYDVARRIEMHESTVSRAIRDKYLQCKWGVFPLSAFFPIGVAARPLPQAGREGGEVTPEYIKARLRELLEREDKTAPLSDRVLTERLNSQGIDISRRTVAKYREAMGYPGIGGRRAY